MDTELRAFGGRQQAAAYAALVDGTYWLVGDLMLGKDLPWNDVGFFGLGCILVLLPLAVAVPAALPVVFVGSFVPRELKEGWRRWTGRIASDFQLPEGSLNEFTPLALTAIIGGIGAAVMG